MWNSQWIPCILQELQCRVLQRSRSEISAPFFTKFLLSISSFFFFFKFSFSFFYLYRSSSSDLRSLSQKQREGERERERRKGKGFLGFWSVKGMETANCRTFTREMMRREAALLCFALPLRLRSVEFGWPFGIFGVIHHPPERLFYYVDESSEVLKNGSTTGCLEMWNRSDSKFKWMFLK